MRWPQDATDWPLTEHSRIIAHLPHRWHVQEAGTGPTLLLLHGAGGATQSWRGLFPLLAKTHHVIAIDLPGQGFTRVGVSGRFGLDATADDILSLTRHEGWHPVAIIGHSAGAAIALRMAELMGRLPPAVIGINAALGSFEGLAGVIYPLMARLLALTPFTASLFVATSSSPQNIRKLIAGTGSTLDARGLSLYHRLARDRAHVDATLKMMAHWSLDGLMARLGQIKARTLFLVGDVDRAVPPAMSEAAASVMPDARVNHIPGLGHLAHEEAPEIIAGAILEFLIEAPTDSETTVPVT